MWQMFRGGWEGPSQISMVESFCENSQKFSAGHCFSKKAPS